MIRTATLEVTELSITDELIERAGDYAEGFDKGGLAAPPGKRVAIVTCMDARVSPYAIFGLREGDAHVIRNAGGTVTDDVERSLAISQRELGTEEIIVMHHSGCGMLGLDDERFAGELERETGQRPAWAPGGFSDIEADVRDAVARLQASPFIPRKDGIRGFVYEVESGRVRELV